MIPYSSPLWIIEAVSNNAFSWSERNNRRLYVTDLIKGTVDDVKEGKEIVFEDFDEHGTLQSCHGLEHFVLLHHPRTNKPIYVVDNHNHVFYFWFEALKKGWIRENATLVHLDGHRDTRVPERNPSREEREDLKQLAVYTNTILNVGNYIPPAMAVGLIGRTHSVISEEEMKQYTPQPTANLIANIDLDFWAPELDYIDQESKDEFARNWMQEADLITLATSPFFINQTKAIETLKRLISSG